MGLPTPKMPLPGIRLIADAAGSYIDDVNNIRLSDKFTLTRNTADPSAAIDLDLSVVGAGFQPIDADLTAISALSTTAYGRALLTLANQAALVGLLPNSGSSVGRLMVPVLIDDSSATSASYTSPSWAANAYRALKLTFMCSTGPSGNDAKVLLTGLSGNRFAVYNENNGTATANLALTDWIVTADTNGFCEATMNIANGGFRTFRGDFYSSGSYSGVCRGIHEDTTHDVTALTITWNASCAHRVILEGIPL